MALSIYTEFSLQLCLRLALISYHQPLTAGPQVRTAANLAQGPSKLKSKQCCRLSFLQVETLTAQASRLSTCQCTCLEKWSYFLHLPRCHLPATAVVLTLATWSEHQPAYSAQLQVLLELSQALPTRIRSSWQL